MATRALVSGASSYLVGSTGAAMSAELRSRVYEHMQILPLTWYQERKQGDILSLLSSDAEVISQLRHQEPWCSCCPRYSPLSLRLRY